MKKKPHKAVNYRPTASTKVRCGTCSMYVDDKPPSCTYVESPIRPRDTCDQWEPKEEEAA